jgi:hypothetical protein
MPQRASVFSPLRRLAIWALVLTVLGAALGVQAEDSNDYDATVKRAVAEFEQGNWDESSALFRRAHTLSPSARTWRGLGITSFELRRYVDAIAELEAALADPRKPLTPKLRSEAEDVLRRAREFVSVYRVRVAPNDAEVVVDGRAVKLGDGQLLLDPGAHTVVVRAPGYREREAQLRAAAGVKEEMTIELSVAGPPESETPAPPSAVVAEPAPASAPVAPVDTHAPQRRRVWTWVLGAGAVAGGVAALSVGLATKSKSRALRHCEANDGDCQSLSDRGNALNIGTNVSIGMAGALAVGAVVAFFLEGRPSAARADQARVRVVPSGLGVLGTF